MNTFEIIQRVYSGGGSGAMVTPGTPGMPGAPGAPGAPAMALPEARWPGGLTVRPAVEGDLKFIDSLQKMHSHMVGFAPMKQLQAHVAKGEILIAEGTSGGAKHQIGYCIAKYQYKRDDIGIVYQLNVLPITQRHLVGATLVKATFDRAPYGVRLFCCWCAQDIQANFFWESIGFIPLAFRTGSRGKQRIHIFWQRRVREGDEVTPYWFPSQTQNGAVREDRLVIPIPPGTHWRDAKPVLLPGSPSLSDATPGSESQGALTLPGGALVKPRPEQPVAERKSKAQVAAIARSKSKHLGGVPAGKAMVISRGGVKYVDRADAPPMEEEIEAPKRKRARNTKPRQKHDPALVEAARELRDRYLEQVNASMLLPPGACGKYEVSRQLGPGSRLENPGRRGRPGGRGSRGSASSTKMKIEQVKVEQVKLLDAA